jgi:hypothetical protein
LTDAPWPGAREFVKYGRRISGSFMFEEVRSSAASPSEAGGGSNF